MASYDTFDTDTVYFTGTLSNANLTALGGGTSLSSPGLAQLFEGKTSGKWYVEFTCNAVSGNTDGVGINTSNGVNQNWLGNDTNSQSWGYFTNDHLLWATANQTHVNGATWGAAQVIGMAIDLDNKLLWFTLTGGSTWIGTSGTPNPATATGGFSITQSLGGRRVYPCINNSGALAKFTINTGATAFSGAVPTGFFAGWTNTIAGSYFGTLAKGGIPGQPSSWASNSKFVSRWLSGITGNIGSMETCMNNGPATNQVVACLYADNAGAPGALIAVSGAPTNPGGTGSGEFTFPFSGPAPVVSGNYYWAGLVTAAPASLPAIYCAPLTSGFDAAANAATFPSADANFGTPSSTQNWRLPMLAFLGNGGPVCYLV